MGPHHEDRHGSETARTAGVSATAKAADPARDRFRDPDSVLVAALELALVLVDAARASEFVDTPSRSFDQLMNFGRYSPETEL